MKVLRLFVLAVVMTGLTFSPALAADAEKIGYVDLSYLFDEYQKTKEYDVLLEKKHSEFEEERNKKIEKIREAQGKLGLLAEGKKAELEEEIEQMKTELLEYDQQNKVDLTKERNDKIREILQEIEVVVSDYASKEGYTFVFNDRVLVYGQEMHDLTDPILKKLNASYKK